MADKSILFNTEMVRAILEGRKTQTRRIVKNNLFCNISDFPSEFKHYDKAPYHIAQNQFKYEFQRDDNNKAVGFLNSPYAVGDILWVRETWGNYSHDNYYLYKADYQEGASTYSYDDEHECDLPKWRPSIHMPREAARLFLKVTDVRVERLQDITDEGAKLEGFEDGTCLEARELFLSCWNEIYKNQNENTWVWVIEFERVR